jgi:hypothetical protein
MDENEILISHFSTHYRILRHGVLLEPKDLHPSVCLVVNVKKKSMPLPRKGKLNRPTPYGRQLRLKCRLRGQLCSTRIQYILYFTKCYDMEQTGTFFMNNKRRT